MDDRDVLKVIKSDILIIKKLIEERNTDLIFQKYSELKDKLKKMKKEVKLPSKSYAPSAIDDILNKSFSEKKNSKNISKVKLCIADADSYISYYVDRINND